MTREQAELKIAEKLREIYKIAFEEYGIEDNYLSLDIINGSINFNNTSWEEDNPKILDYQEKIII